MSRILFLVPHQTFKRVNKRLWKRLYSVIPVLNSFDKIEHFWSISPKDSTKFVWSFELKGAHLKSTLEALNICKKALKHMKGFHFHLRDFTMLHVLMYRHTRIFVWFQKRGIGTRRSHTSLVFLFVLTECCENSFA